MGNRAREVKQRSRPFARALESRHRLGGHAALRGADGRPDGDLHGARWSSSRQSTICGAGGAWRHRFSQIKPITPWRQSHETDAVDRADRRCRRRGAHARPHGLHGALSPDQMSGMLAAHGRMMSRMMNGMGADMRGMQMSGDAGWNALVDSVKAGLAELPGLKGQALAAEMKAHAGRVERLMAMHEGMMR